MGKKLTTEEFIKQAKKIHGNKYDYSKVEYINGHTKVCIICPKHGEFWQTPSSHKMKIGCPLCGGKIKNNEIFIERAKKIHGDKYDYSKVEYVNSNKKICIICPEHGEFWQTPKDHLQNRGCPICGGKVKLSTKEFIERAKKIHGDKYDYSKVEYKGMHTKVCIICPKHGEFWQTPDNHLRFGCKKCCSSKLENKIREFLLKNNIKFEEQKKFKWLKYKNELKLDFYLSDYNIAIECQGEQHFEKYRWEKNNEGLEKRKIRDKVKYFLCKEIKNIEIIYYTNSVFFEEGKKYCNNLNDLEKIIKSYGKY